MNIKNKLNAMKKVIYLITILFLSACGKNSNIPKDVKYEIINEIKDFNFNKCNLDIRLNKKVDKQILADIANELRKDRKKFDKLWIGYYLPDMVPGKGSWAITNFTPDLEVEILGTTENESRVMLDSANAFNVDGLIGKWENTRLIDKSIYVIYNDSKGNAQIKKILKDGSSYLLENVKSKNKNEFHFGEKIHGEYFKIEENGNLGLYNPEKKAYEMIKLK